VGGTGPAVAIVLAAFMGGLALGSRFFGSRVDRSTAPLLFYARLETAIAVLGILVLPAAAALTRLYIGTVGALPESAALAPRLLVAAILLLPPTFLMGGTLPAAAGFLVRSDRRVGSGVGAVYAANTGGAVLGALVAGFVLIQGLGLPGTVAAAAAGNLVAALGAFLLHGMPGGGRGRGPAPGATAPDSGSPAPVGRVGPKPEELSSRVLHLIFALSGFAALALEIFWTRALHAVLGNSTYAYATMLSTFLAGLAAGGWAGGLLADRVRSPALWLGRVQIGIGLATALTLPALWTALPALAAEGWLSEHGATWGAYLLRRFAVGFAVMAPATFLFGAVLPLAARAAVPHAARIGAGLGSLYLANTLGAIGGALAAGFILLPALGARGGVAACAGLSLLLGFAALAAMRRTSPRRALAPALPAAVAAAAAFGFGARGAPVLGDSQDPRDAVVFRAEDAVAATSVYRKPDGELHMSVDGHHIGGTNPNVLRKEKVLAHLPMLLVPEARSVFAVGLGTGITLGSFARYPRLDRLTCAEIAPGVVAGARRFAGPNGEVLDDPRVTVRVEDGIQHLLTRDDRYDVICSDSKLNPEFVGNAAILSRDYYALARSRLAKGGVFVQWLPVHLPLSEIRLIVRTLADVFPSVSLIWYEPTNLLLVGAEKPAEIRTEAVDAALAIPAVRTELEELDLADPCLLASMPVLAGNDLRDALGPGPVNSWARPRLEFSVVRAGFGQRRSELEHRTLEWLRTAGPGALPLAGARDPERLARFRASAGKLLEGYSAAGGAVHPATGTASFLAGLRINPEDIRLQRVVRYLERRSAGASIGRSDG
jgi:spermidine synthase